MSDITYLKNDLMTLECELETLEEYTRCKDFPEAKDDDFGGIRGTFNPMQLKFAKDYLIKRIAWYEEEIYKLEQEVA